jgi:apolipoprotein N-acyltransferase
MKGLLLTSLAAILYAVSFEPVALWFCAPVAYALLFLVLNRFQRTVIHVSLFALLSHLMILSWTNSFVGSIPWILLSLLQVIYILPLGYFARKSRSVPLFIFLVLVSESIKSRIPFGGFAWTRIAFSQSDSPFSPLVRVVGITGLSAITLLVAYLLLSPKKGVAFSILALFLVSQLIPISPKSTESLNVLAVQGGVPERGLNFNARAQAVLDLHMARTWRDRDGSEDLIIWPENAIDVDPIKNIIAERKLYELVSSIDTELLAGAIVQEAGIHNVSVLFDTSGAAKSIYSKRKLTPFGEYIPLRSIAEIISPYADDVTDFTVGSKRVIHEVQGHPIGSVICYEILTDGLVRDTASSSDLLVVHTNSATFSGSSEGLQQLAITRLRAIESGKFIISVSTTGPSAVVDPRGEVLQILEDGQTGSIKATIPFIATRTIATRLGGWLEVAVLLLAGFFALTSLRRERYSL